MEVISVRFLSIVCLYKVEHDEAERLVCPLAAVTIPRWPVSLPCPILSPHWHGCRQTLQGSWKRLGIYMLGQSG